MALHHRFQAWVPFLCMFPSLRLSVSVFIHLHLLPSLLVLVSAPLGLCPYWSQSSVSSSLSRILSPKQDRWWADEGKQNRGVVSGALGSKDAKTGMLGEKTGESSQGDLQDCPWYPDLRWHVGPAD